MWIYKITNIQNGKIYIGQTIRSIEQRFKRHIADALNGNLDTHFARAIRKYGKDNFKLELVCSCSSHKDMCEKEQYWIRYYNSIEDGYNETDALNKCGGNTYQSKTPEEMKVIAEKIRATKLGNKNPMAKRVKRINIQTNEIEIFDTVIACAQACGIKNGKTSISNRLNGQIKSPYKNTWIFEYYDE